MDRYRDIILPAMHDWSAAPSWQVPLGDHADRSSNPLRPWITYTPHGWLANRTVGGTQMFFGYTPHGTVSSVTEPKGNYLQCTQDAAGDKTTGQTYDASGTLHQSVSRTFNALGQLNTVMVNNTVFNASASDSYDANVYLVQSTDELGIQRQLGYDALNRLVLTHDSYDGTN